MGPPEKTQGEVSRASGALSMMEAGHGTLPRLTYLGEPKSRSVYRNGHNFRNVDYLFGINENESTKCEEIPYSSTPMLLGIPSKES